MRRGKFTVGTKDQQVVYLKAVDNEHGEQMFEVEWTPDEARLIARMLTEKADLLTKEPAE